MLLMSMCIQLSVLNFDLLNISVQDECSSVAVDVVTKQIHETWHKFCSLVTLQRILENCFDSEVTKDVDSLYDPHLFMTLTYQKIETWIFGFLNVQSL